MAGVASAADDVGVASQVTGEVMIQIGAGQHPVRAKAFMRLREGDQLTLPASAALKLVFFENGRLESWAGPARFTLGRAESVALSGAPVVSTLPMLAAGRPVLEKIGRFSRAGGIVLRNVAAPAARTGVPDPVALVEARAQREEWAAKVGADDILPDLYLLAVLQEHRATEEMLALLGAMERKQPDNPDLKELSRFLRGGP